MLGPKLFWAQKRLKDNNNNKNNKSQHLTFTGRNGLTCMKSVWRHCKQCLESVHVKSGQVKSGKVNSGQVNSG